MCIRDSAVITALIERDLVAASAEMGRGLMSRLEARLGQHPHVGDIRGRGLFIGMELVEDRQTKAPFDPKRAVNARVKRAAFDAGLMCYPMGGTIDGRTGDHVLLAPPFIVTDDDLDQIVERVAAAIDVAVAPPSTAKVA